MKLLLIYLIFLIIFSCNYSLEDTKSIKSSSTESYDSKSIKWKGWVRFFKTKHNKPKNFIVNNEYSKIRVKITDMKKKQVKSGNYKPITNLDFFGIIIDDKINILNSQVLKLRNTVETLNLNYVIPLSKKKGIVSLGSTKEGYCVTIDLNLPKHHKYNPDYHNTDDGIHENWTICIEYGDNFNSFYNEIVTKTREIQNTLLLGNLNDPNHKPDTSIGTALSRMNNPQPKSEKSTNPPDLDGKWIILQDWTQCSVVCGDGVQYQQRICIPPKVHGAPCQGKAVLQKVCHRVKCPETRNTDLVPDTSTIGPLIRHTIITSAPISTKPLRSEYCQIKETFALLIVKDLETKDKSQILIRLVMNLNTVSAFRGDDYEDEVFTANLIDTNIRHVRETDNPECCFNLDNLKFSYLICQVQGSCRKDNTTFSKIWMKDLDIFKHKCKVDQEKLRHERQEFFTIENQKRQQLGQEEAEKCIQAKLNKIRERETVAEEEENTSLLLKTQGIATNALTKEIKLEDMIKKEEKEREDAETQEILRQIETEKKRQEYIKKAIKEREKVDENLEAKIEAKNEVNKIKAEAVAELKRKRTELKKKISEMRKLKQRRNSRLLMELENIRKATAEAVTKSSKSGSSENCAAGSKSEAKRKSYCKDKFGEDLIKFNECYNKDEFCFVCCETEFGQLNMVKRHACYKSCSK